jgi:hypothetical protein
MCSPPAVNASARSRPETTSEAQRGLVTSVRVHPPFVKSHPQGPPEIDHEPESEHETNKADHRGEPEQAEPVPVEEREAGATREQHDGNSARL